jgi:predicted enzyme related to lactoylglutathione lyase
MTSSPRIGAFVFDAADIEKLSAFYADLTGWALIDKDEDWITLRPPAGHDVDFQLAPDHVPPAWPGQDRPQQMHLDLQVDGIEAAAERAVALGATRLGAGSTWITLADPAGHPFDLCQKDGHTGPMALFAATIDAPDATGLARFYAALMDMELTYEGPEGAMISGGEQSLMFQQVENYTPPRWPDPAHPQQAHLDIKVDDIAAGEARALELGATRIGDGTDTFTVFADPAGHPFCICAC